MIALEKCSESISLHYQAGNSDKIYYASLEESGDLYVVNFSYGRRGSALKSGTKTNTPVNYENAKSIYNKLIKEKTSKGYQVVSNESKNIWVSNENKEIVESKCVLLNPITEAELVNYLHDEDWVFQEKMDGVRFMLHKDKDSINSYNRKGSFANIPVEIYNLFQNSKDNFFMDGELVGNIFYVFDLVEYNDMDLRNNTYFQRISILEKVINNINSEFIVFVPTETIQKEDFLNKLLKENKEGVVIKNKNAKYYTGRPASYGDYLKFKFYSTCSCIVKEINQNKRSISVQLFRNKKIVDAGKVAIPVNFEMPCINDIVEVRYLYAFKQSGRLYQPVYLGIRDDINHSDCQQTQLKFKNEDE